MATHAGGHCIPTDKTVVAAAKAFVGGGGGGGADGSKPGGGSKAAKPGKAAAGGGEKKVWGGGGGAEAGGSGGAGGWLGRSAATAQPTHLLLPLHQVLMLHGMTQNASVFKKRTVMECVGHDFRRIPPLSTLPPHTLPGQLPAQVLEGPQLCLPRCAPPLSPTLLRHRSPNNRSTFLVRPPRRRLLSSCPQQQP